jgi:hypothetical protein
MMSADSNDISGHSIDLRGERGGRDRLRTSVAKHPTSFRERDKSDKYKNERSSSGYYHTASEHSRERDFLEEKYREDFFYYRDYGRSYYLKRDFDTYRSEFDPYYYRRDDMYSPYGYPSVEYAPSFETQDTIKHSPYKKKKSFSSTSQQNVSSSQQKQQPKNDYCQHFVDTRLRPQNFIRDTDLESRFEEYEILFKIQR